MTLVAISAAYGAGGSQVGPAVAERLGIEFLDRAIPVAVAERLEVPVDAAAAYDEQPTESWIDRLLRGFIGTDVWAPTPLPADAVTSEDFVRATERVLCRQAETGEGVILGRAGVIVLRDRDDVLRVRLDGSPERRVRQAMSLGALDRETAQRALRKLDSTHAEYARRFYSADITDPRLYHLMIDSTAIDLDTCAEMIVTAARALSARAVIE